LLELGSMVGEDGESAKSPEEGFSPDVVYMRLRQLVGSLSGFSITPRLVLGNFSYQKMAMVKDLQIYGKELAAHDIIAALAGDAMARVAVRSERQEIDPRELDKIHPDNEFLILDADSSQQTVIQSALLGQSGVIQGPPGTGKSQTIANLIAGLAGIGKS